MKLPVGYIAWQYEDKKQWGGSFNLPTEADTCRKFAVPKLQSADWDNDPHSIAEQRTITDAALLPAILDRAFKGEL